MKAIRVLQEPQYDPQISAHDPLKDEVITYRAGVMATR